MEFCKISLFRSAHPSIAAGMCVVLEIDFVRHLFGRVLYAIVH